MLWQLKTKVIISLLKIIELDVIQILLTPNLMFVFYIFMFPTKAKKGKK